MQTRVLIVDDDKALARSIQRGLEQRGAKWELVLCHSREEARKNAESDKFDVVLTDLSIDEAGPQGGIELVRNIGSLAERIVVMTGSRDDNLGVEALMNGASNFLPKPVDMDHLYYVLVEATNYASLKRTLSMSSQPELTLGISSNNSAMRTTLADAAFAASNSHPVFIIGETGTGKGVLANAIHSASKRKSGKLVRCQPSFANADIVSSELFGHVRGAFTGAEREKEGLIRAADRGTLFIDEIDMLPTETQVVLLNTLQERVFRKVGSTVEERSDFRLISASNIPEESLEEKLRTDFLHRIAHLRIRIPPLRERPEDIAMLAGNFLKSAAEDEGVKIHGFSESSYSKLRTYHWPGNVRELQASVAAAVSKAAFNKRSIVEPEDFSFQPTSKPRAAGAFRDMVKSYEEKLVEEALEFCGGNQSEAARHLQMDRASFRRVLQRVSK